MANTTVAATVGDGSALLAVDNLGSSVLIQRAKAAWGVAGTAVDVSATNPMPVVSSIDQTTPGTTNFVTANVTQIAGSLIATGHGTASGAIRVEFPTDSTGVLNAAQSGSWNISNITGTVSLPNGAATSAKQPALGSAGAASPDVITIQGVGSMTPVQVSQATAASLNATVVGTGTFATQSVLTTGSAQIGHLEANQTVNVAQIGGVAPSVSSGNKDTGTLRVVLATDQPALTNSLLVTASGDVANGSSDSGNPLKIGGVGKTTNPTAVTDGQRVNGLYDKLGKKIVVSAIRDLKGKQKTTITSSVSETTIVTAAGANVFADLYSLIIANTSATACNVTIKDSTAGTTQMIIAVPAGETRGFIVDCGSAVTQTTANNNWSATCSASVASIEITALYVKNL